MDSGLLWERWDPQKFESKVWSCNGGVGWEGLFVGGGMVPTVVVAVQVASIKSSSRARGLQQGSGNEQGL